MPSVLDRSALEQSPLADLHLLANELGVDGFRRLRKPDLVDAILARQSGDESSMPPSRRRGRGGRRRRAGRRAPAESDDDGPEALAPRPPRRPRPAPRRGRGRRPRSSTATSPSPRRQRRRRAATSAPSRAPSSCSPTAPASCASRRRSRPTTTSTSPPRRSSAASSSPATRSAGPMRAPRRSERFPSLIRVDTINGRPAEEVAEGTRFEDLPVAWPDERIELGSDDPTVHGDRVADAVRQGLARASSPAPSRSGKSEALRRLAGALARALGARGQRGAGRRAARRRSPTSRSRRARR